METEQWALGPVHCFWNCAQCPEGADCQVLEILPAWAERLPGRLRCHAGSCLLVLPLVCLAGGSGRSAPPPGSAKHLGRQIHLDGCKCKFFGFTSCITIVRLCKMFSTGIKHDLGCAASQVGRLTLLEVLCCLLYICLLTYCLLQKHLPLTHHAATKDLSTCSKWERFQAGMWQAPWCQPCS